MTDIPFRELFYTSQDGLRLFARDYGDRISKLTPIICLPGLTRNSKDFDELAQIFATDRRVICPDLRGRGRSQYCAETDYTPVHEMNDIFDLMATVGIHQANFIGTSRGGIVTMLIATFRPNAIRSAVLNDVGPEIGAEGIKRIAETAASGETPDTWTEAAFRLRMMHERNFPSLQSEEWYAWAKRSYAEENEVPKVDYDVKIGIGLRKALEACNGQLPPLWAQFKALSHVPVLVIRGENSDILSSETLDRMQTEHRNLTTLTVKDRGHVPFLNEPDVLAALSKFLEEPAQEP